MSDYYSDQGHLFAKIFSSFSMPEFSKNAELLDEDRLKALPKTAFADQDGRNFPICDRSHCFVSAAYAYAQPNLKTAEDAIPVIEKAASLFGIESEIQSLKAHIDGMTENQKVAEKVSTPFDISFGNNQKLAGESDNDLGAAIEYFLQHKYDLNFDQRSKTASELFSEAKDRAITIPEELSKTAGIGSCDVNVLKSALAKRAIFLVDSLEKQAILKVAEGSNLSDVDGLKKVAKAIADFDESHMLDGRFYFERWPDPHQSVFNQSEENSKKAILEVRRSSYPYGVWTGGVDSSFREGLLAALGKEAADRLYTDGAFDSEKVAELSEQQKALVDRYLA